MRAFRGVPVSRDASSLAQPPDITGLLGYRLHAIVAKISSVAIRICEGRYGISRREWHIMGLLDARGPQTPSQLAGSCHLDRPRVSRAISALAAKGLVIRRPVENDRKRALLSLTSAGRELQKRIFEDIACVNAAVIEGLDEEQLQQLHRLLVFLSEKADIINRETAGDVRVDRWRGRSGRMRWSAGSG
ncbi:MAG TPA: MarR family transcriptional regulator [Burkholderiales bacterium]